MPGYPELHCAALNHDSLDSVLLAFQIYCRFLEQKDLPGFDRYRRPMCPVYLVQTAALGPPEIITFGHVFLNSNNGSVT